MELLYALLVGAIAGWLAGKIMRGGGFGLIINIILGIIGGFVGNWLLPKLGVYIGSGLIPDILNALIGAIVILLIAGLLKRK